VPPADPDSSCPLSAAAGQTVAVVPPRYADAGSSPPDRSKHGRRTCIPTHNPPGQQPRRSIGRRARVLARSCSPSARPPLVSTARANVEPVEAEPSRLVPWGAAKRVSAGASISDWPQLRSGAEQVSGMVSGESCEARQRPHDRSVCSRRKLTLGNRDASARRGQVGVGARASSGCIGARAWQVTKSLSLRRHRA
jgi:hypothetical protein